MGAVEVAGADGTEAPVKRRGAQQGFRHWLPAREPLLWPGDNASAAEQQAWHERRQAHANGLLKLPESA